MPYRIEYSPEAEEHLRGLTARQQRTILDTVDVQLAHQPDMETRNRKKMRPNPLAPWELRIGTFRVYYDIENLPDLTVSVRAIGVKQRDKVIIGGKVITL